MYFVPKLYSKWWFKSYLKYKFRMVSYGYRLLRLQTPGIFEGTPRVPRSPRCISSQNSANAKMALSNRVVC